MLNANPPPVNPAFANKKESDRPTPSAPPPYNSSFVKPSAPPFNVVKNQSYTHGGFFGASNLNHDQLGREMLEAVVMNKTDWVIKAALPSDTTFNNILGYFGGMFSSSPSLENIDEHMKSKLWRQVGELGYAQMLGDQKLIQACERKTDTLFQSFLSQLDDDERKPEHCFKVSLEYQVSPEAHFDTGKLHYLTHNYEKAIESFQNAELHANSLEKSSKYRILSFSALMKNCGGAAQERLGYHDRALFNYIDASKTDPNGSSLYQESLSRNFQILKFKPNKCDEELQACIEYDPYEPDFTIELGFSKLNQGHSEEAMKLLNLSNELAFLYKTQSLYRCVELAQQIAFYVNNTSASHR